MKKAGTAAGQLNSWTDIRFQVERVESSESHRGPRITVRYDTDEDEARVFQREKMDSFLSIER